MERKMYNLKVLYIEDEKESQREMARFLKRRFSKVILADNGVQGLEKFAELQPDFIITDLLMPEMGGLDLVKNLREQGFRCPVIITSALEDVNTILKSVDLGIVKYSIKPIDTENFSETLLALAEQIIHGREAEFPFKISEKKELETEIKSRLSSLLKSCSGKGPRDVSVFIGSRDVEITSRGTLTAMEETLTQKGDNLQLVEQTRIIFYRMIGGDIEKLISEIIGFPSKISECRVNPSRNTDVLVVRYFP